MRSLFALAGAAAVARLLAGCNDAGPVQPSTDPSLAPAAAGSRPPFVFPESCCYYQGSVVRTVVPPASTPQEGRDNFYGFPSGGAPGQKGVVGVVPGSPGYHGGHWAFHAVTFNVTPYLLTSEEAVLAAAAAGDVTIVRVAADDFRCPIQP